ncbi:MAG: hypothetical protein Tp1124DCM412261_44 [Prokaryotic dsDNA virus sp.]|nr:MAG: hypothetical protein Tp1123DCM939791_34 [Prokaryotic dsDNA virus sp.]QDP59876.1 MAG: hypothetical protein Tp1124DCM412261_44 [Prokaryotic dsDNA virus sp.]|tara:strand:- start:3141 stop:3758 length:618 start_codon:yes stop_codon:yes gene_type:complete
MSGNETPNIVKTQQYNYIGGERSFGDENSGTDVQLQFTNLPDSIETVEQKYEFNKKNPYLGMKIQIDDAKVGKDFFKFYHNQYGQYIPNIHNEYIIKEGKEGDVNYMYYIPLPYRDIPSRFQQDKWIEFTKKHDVENIIGYVPVDEWDYRVNLIKQGKMRQWNGHKSVMEIMWEYDQVPIEDMKSKSVPENYNDYSYPTNEYPEE